MSNQWKDVGEFCLSPISSQPLWISAPEPVSPLGTYYAVNKAVNLQGPLHLWTLLMCCENPLQSSLSFFKSEHRGAPWGIRMDHWRKCNFPSAFTPCRHKHEQKEQSCTSVFLSAENSLLTHSQLSYTWILLQLCASALVSPPFTAQLSLLQSQTHKTANRAISHRHNCKTENPALRVVLSTAPWLRKAVHNPSATPSNPAHNLNINSTSDKCTDGSRGKTWKGKFYRKMFPCVPREFEFGPEEHFLMERGQGLRGCQVGSPALGLPQPSLTLLQPSLMLLQPSLMLPQPWCCPSHPWYSSSHPWCCPTHPWHCPSHPWCFFLCVWQDGHCSQVGLDDPDVFSHPKASGTLWNCGITEQAGLEGISQGHLDQAPAINGDIFQRTQPHPTWPWTISWGIPHLSGQSVLVFYPHDCKKSSLHPIQTALHSSFC